MCPLQEREQKALNSTQRALELQQLAAGTDSTLESSQLSAAAQRCTAQAEEAAQVASLARAEAARLVDHGPSLGNAAECPAPVFPSMVALLAGALPSDESTALPAGEAADTAAAAEAALPVRVNAGIDVSAAEHAQSNTQLSAQLSAQLSTSRMSLEVIRGLSLDMQAAMQQLVASAHSSSLATLPGAESGGPNSAMPSRDMGTATEFGQGQGLPDLHTSTLAASSSYQMPHLPDQASWQIPSLNPNPVEAMTMTAGIPALPEQATGEGVEDEVPSGMQIHLMHQLDGLERSVRRVEQQVSSAKQTRRRLKIALLPAQVTLPSILGTENICMNSSYKS